MTYKEYNMKVGDKVKIISGNFSGEFGTIIHIDNKSCPTTFVDVILNSNKSVFCFSQNDLFILEENNKMSMESDLTEFFMAIADQHLTPSELETVKEVLSNALRQVRGDISIESELALTHALIDSNMTAPIKR